MKILISPTFTEQGDEKGQLYLESDSMQFILREYWIGTNKDGEPKESSKTLGYYPSIASVLTHAFKMRIMESQANDLAELVKDYQELSAWFRDQFDLLKHVTKDGEVPV